jgi:ElaB/YqjD/DUF883 family membrane-anchored ribosome-binding protein
MTEQEAEGTVVEAKVESPEAPSSDATARQRLRSQTETVREDLRELGKITKDVAGEQIEVARKEVKEMEDHLLSYVREKPVKSLLIAGGVGLVLGVLLVRR